MSINTINRTKPAEVGCVVYIDGYKSKVTKITDDGVVGLVLDEGLITEFRYECLLHDISLDNGGDLVLDTKFVPVVGDVISVNEKEYQLVDIEENVVTLKRGDEIRYYSFYDIEHDIINNYWISSMCEQARSPTVNRKLDVYEVQDGVYSYNSFDELNEIYELLGEPFTIHNFYGTDGYENLINSLQHKHGLIHYWEDYDSERDYTYTHMKVIDGACINGEM